MSFIEDLPRQVIPRWRPFTDTLEQGELSLIPIEQKARFSADVLAERLADWAHRPTMSVAADLVSAAFTLGMKGVANDAADFIIRNGAELTVATALAREYLLDEAQRPRRHLTDVRQQRPLSQYVGNLSEADRVKIAEVHRLRELLGQFPRNAIEWCNLALLYTSLGVIEKANRAMMCALALAPNNRFVVRAAARFLLHIGEGDKALHVLSRVPQVVSDPWILAAEIATADALHEKSPRLKTAKRMLEQKVLPINHLAELASAMGTIELKAGSAKQSKRLIALSLEDPTENAVAQAGWVARQTPGGLYIPAFSSPEAAAWHLVSSAQWSSALTMTKLWHEDQPFSSRPAANASFISATIFERWEESKQFAIRGLRSNRDDLTLLNNAAFAAAMNGDLAEAEDFAVRMKTAEAGRRPRIAAMATNGLIAYRQGNTEEGRRLYGEAIDEARLLGAKEFEAAARAYRAMEELRLDTQEGEPMCDEAIRFAERAGGKMVTVFAEIVRRHMTNAPPPPMEDS